MTAEQDLTGTEAGRHRPILDDPTARAMAADAVQQLVAGLQDGLDHADADVYDRQFAADVLWGSPYGATVRGYQALNAIHHSLMAAGTAPPSRFQLVQVLSPLPGVAIAHVRRDDITARSGEGFSEMAMYVLIEREGRWWLAAGQNAPLTDRSA
jgi:uncharacterized protein (TIGR02246 family)